VTFVAAWLATSSTRLSYAGVQVAFGFYIVHLTDFSFQTNLTFPRDRVLGVVLGITMMWLVFERLFTRSAGDEMVRAFVANLRLMAGLISSIPLVNKPDALLKMRRTRDQIYRGFGDVGAQADAVPFETGPARAGDMAARERIVRWQALLRSFYLLESPLLQFRIFSKVEDVSDSFRAFHDDFRAECARIFLQIAGSLEDQKLTHMHRAGAIASIVSRIQSPLPDIEAKFSEREHSLLRLIQSVARLVDRLQSEVASQGLYEVAGAPAPLPGLSRPEASEA
jgi:multidrug resistance protein MdtO